METLELESRIAEMKKKNHQMSLIANSRWQKKELANFKTQQ